MLKAPHAGGAMPTSFGGEGAASREEWQGKSADSQGADGAEAGVWAIEQGLEPSISVDFETVGYSEPSIRR